MDEIRKAKSGVSAGESTASDDLAEYGVWVKAGPEDVLSDEVTGFSDDYNMEDLSEPASSEENEAAFITPEEEDLLGSLGAEETGSAPEELADFTFDDFPEEASADTADEDFSEKMPDLPAEEADAFTESDMPEISIDIDADDLLTETRVTPESDFQPEAGESEDSDFLALDSMDLPDISVDLPLDNLEESQTPEPDIQSPLPKVEAAEDDDAGFEEISLDLGESEINDLNSFEDTETPDSTAPEEPLMSRKDEPGKNTGNGDFTEVSLDDFIDFDSLESDEATSKKEEMTTETDSKQPAEENQFLDLDLEMDESASLDSSMDSDKLIDDYLDLDSLPEEPLSGKTGSPSAAVKAASASANSDQDDFPDMENLQVEEISLDDFGFSNESAQEFPESGMESNDESPTESFGFDEQNTEEKIPSLDADLSFDEEITLPDSLDLDLPSSDNSDEITLDSGDSAASFDSDEITLDSDEITLDSAEMDLSLPEEEAFEMTADLETVDETPLSQDSLPDDLDVPDFDLELSLDDDALVLEEDKALQELSFPDMPADETEPDAKSPEASAKSDSGLGALSFDDEIENISDEDIDLDNLPDFASFEPEAGFEEVLPTAADSVEELEEMEEIDLGDLDENGIESELPELELDEPSFDGLSAHTEDLITTPDDESITTADLDEPMFEEDFPQVESAKPGPSSSDSSMLSQIAQELKSIKNELSSLKTELSTLRAKEAKTADVPLAQDLVVPETDEDETIALTGDELDNILSSADFHEEDGIEEPEDFGAFGDTAGQTDNGEPIIETTYLDEVPDLSSFDANQIIFEEDEEIDLSLDESEKPAPIQKKPKPADTLPETSIQNEDEILSGTNLESALTSDEKVLPSSDNRGIPETISLVPTNKGSGNLPDNLKGEIKSVIGYLDQLLDSLPKEKIAEFTESEHFIVYKKLFKDLGLG